MKMAYKIKGNPNIMMTQKRRLTSKMKMPPKLKTTSKIKTTQKERQTKKLRDVQQERKETIFLQVITSLKQVRFETSCKHHSNTLNTPLKLL